MQDDSPADHGEEGLQAQQQRDDRRVAVLLRENLQRVAARAREDADVEDVERTLAERREIDRFKGEGADGGEDHHHRELHAGERDAVHLQHNMVHAEDMPREGKGTQETGGKKAYYNPGKERSKIEKKVKKAEEELAVKEEKLDALKQELLRPEYQSSYSKLTEIQGEIDALEEEIMADMENWEALSQQLEELES